ncbi:DUF305 domain-containing protein [Saccharomonospora piscinae]|uniref:DUF305 domain-containing protein n=1 Tax=Saccharomonospora piscinae TaxID=687388 RepID=A0A1V9ABZ0_SACPI|nr:DUF305 domain-containing protein [Saccharomonospora piscinae]OQO94593.1 DUF305 domain-containing protein [Saccharomonospora piscinae]
MRGHRLFLPILLGLTLTAACGAGTGTSTSGGTTAPSSPAGTSAAGENPGGDDHNPSDVEFAQEMVPHHEQAVAVADLALERDGDPAVRELAQRMKAAQEPELTQLLALLRMWGEEVTPGGGNGEHEHSHLMTEETFQQLRNASAAEFDRLWLESMIAHHGTAVELAEAQLRDGRDSLASMYARDIADRQRAEITEMTALLNE